MQCPVCKRPMGLGCIARNIFQRIRFIFKNPRISWWIISKIYPSQQRVASSSTLQIAPKNTIFRSIANKIFHHCIHYDFHVAYKRWQKSYETLLSTGVQSINNKSFLLIITPTNHKNGIDALLQSIENQTVNVANLRIAPTTNSLHEWLLQLCASTKCDYIAIIEHDIRLHERAIEWILHFWPNHDPAIIYGDHDLLTESGERNLPCFKPKWDSILQKSSHYIEPLVFIKRELFTMCIEQGFVNNQQIINNVSLSPNNTFHHVARILSHKNEVSHYFSQCHENRVLQRNDELISIIIPTKDAHQLLANCIDSLVELNDNVNFEIIIVNNNSQEAKTYTYFDSLQAKYSFIRIVDYTLPFNYSDMNNYAVGQARGSILCFVNNDIKLLTKNGLAAMLQYAQQSSTGAVGIKLYYPNMTIQHVGVCLGLGGIAGHLLRNTPKDDSRFELYTHHTRQVSAVTAAFLMLRRNVFEAVDGFDAQNLAVAYNDVDLCLKIEKLGLNNIFVPYVEAIHYESASRPSDFSKQQSKRYIAEGSFFQQKWQATIDAEPFYNQNYGREREDMRLIC